MKWRAHATIRTVNESYQIHYCGERTPYLYSAIMEIPSTILSAAEKAICPPQSDVRYPLQRRLYACSLREDQRDSIKNTLVNKFFDPRLVLQTGGSKLEKKIICTNNIHLEMAKVKD